MEMPAFLPSNLNVYSSTENDDELFDRLVKSNQDLIAFFLIAADDETWSEDHAEFMRKILQHFTSVVFEKKMQFSQTVPIQKKIQQHIKILTPYLPLNIVFQVGSEEVLANSLLFMAATPVFQDLIYNECQASKSLRVRLGDLSLDVFNVIDEFVKTGDVPNLWRFNEEELNTIENWSTKFGLNECGELCEMVLKRYITHENVVETLILAHAKEHFILRNACFEFMNQLDFGVQFHETANAFLAFEFLDFKTNALEIFEQVKHLITHLIFHKNLDTFSEFSYVVNQCPSLIHLNLSGSFEFSDRIFDVRADLAELDISSCPWLKISYLSRIFDHFKNLRGLNLSDNVELDFNSFTQISKLKELNSLNVSKNPQIQDEDFKLILQAAFRVMYLDCSDCKMVGDRGFFELTRSLSFLRFLNLERCQISDGILIEMGVRLSFLEEINLTHCTLLTDRGILDFVKQTKALKSITIKYCNIRESTIAEMKRQRPYLTIQVF